ncbi:hypothetical protein AXG93_3719s1240 [Marchantia polymorpha subsp. ruderalis]|uniref:Uncharacterized protein n=1 Tax=Marchantia polymorpha subsp. ruderalis TaxID=1480154 RepID=A0A176VM87_MARPO|nr:hypothetical protein AXG93_3719s1240 [Marchantia polymorpha subsp. ruderalis]
MICSGPGADQGLNTMDVAFRVREREIDRKATVTMSRQVGTGVHAPKPAPSVMESFSSSVSATAATCSRKSVPRSWNKLIRKLNPPSGRPMLMMMVSRRAASSRGPRSSKKRRMVGDDDGVSKSGMFERSKVVEEKKSTTP